MAVTKTSVDGAARLRRWHCLACLLGALAVSAPVVAAMPMSLQRPQDASTPQDLERLRAMLGQPGPDGRDARETAIERLVAANDPAAHRILQDRLRLSDDTDAVREAILRVLQRAMLGGSAPFGGAADAARRQILTGYMAALSGLWRDPGQALDDIVDQPVRAAARLFLQRVPVRDLDASARVLLGAADVETRVFVLRVLADMQQVLLAQTIADFLEAAEEPVRQEARRSLHLLTCADEEFQTKAQFAAWFERNGSARYVDLVERAARLGPRPTERLRDELARLRVDAARDFVRAITVRTPGIDWATIQARTLVDDPAVLDACLDQLQQSLAAGVPADDPPAPRQSFCRALLQRFRQVAADQTRRRAAMLEVCAYLTRPEETELATEVATNLLAQLETAPPAVHTAALRGLRRFPSAETRGRLVRYATALLAGGSDARDRLLATMTTLASRSAPRWVAPADKDADRAEWLALVAAACRTEGDNDVRTAGLTLAQTLDARDARVAEAFDLLLELVQDARLDTRFRSSCVIHLQGWRTSANADGWVRAMRDLLSDPVADLRQQAAESLARLPELVDARRSEWMTGTIQLLQKRLLAEPNASVLRALVDCLLACGREPQMPELAVGALNGVFGELGETVAPEHQFRLDPLLQALATVAADPHTELGQWLAACRPLCHHQKRQSLRLVLQGHGAIDLAKSVEAADTNLAARARLAMQFVIRTALLKPAKDSWSSSDELQREAVEVRVAFGALDAVDDPDKPDDVAARLLRLEVDLALGKHLDVVQRVNAWLTASNGNGGGNGAKSDRRAAMTPADRDRVRLLAAEAHLALGKADLAAKMLVDLRPEAAKDSAVLDLQSRIARAWFASDAPAAVALLANTWKATPNNDPAFRQRLLDWMTYRVRHEPAARAAVLKEVTSFADLFERQDCPADQREAFEQLRRGG